MGGMGFDVSTPRTVVLVDAQFEVAPRRAVADVHPDEAGRRELLPRHPKRAVVLLRARRGHGAGTGADHRAQSGRERDEGGVPEAGPAGHRARGRRIEMRRLTSFGLSIILTRGLSSHSLEPSDHAPFHSYLPRQ